MSIQNFGKKIKALFFIIIFQLFICNCIFFQSQAGQISETESKESAIDEQYFLQFMDALKNRNADKLFEIWVGDKTESNRDAFAAEFDYWNGREITSYKKLSEERRPENKEEKKLSATIYEYEIISGDELFHLRFSITDEYKGGKYMDSFQFYGKPDTAKAVSDRSPFKLIKWGLLAFQIAEIAFTFYILFLCIKEKPRLWGLWIPFILAVYGGVFLDLTGGLKVGAFIYILRWSELYISSNGIRIYLALPICAVAYYIKRMKGKKSTGESEPDQENG